MTLPNDGGPLTPQDLGIGKLFESVRDAAIVADATTGRIVLWNPAAKEIFGYMPSEAIGMSVEELVPSHLKERHRAGISRYRDTGHGHFIDSNTVLDLPAVRKDGAEIRIELTLSPIEPVQAVETEGRFVLAIVRDVTQRKRAEEEIRRLNEQLEERVAERTARLESALAKLRESEERYRLLVESAKDYAIFMVDTQGRVTSWNTGAERLFGYKEDEIVGKDGSLLFTVEDLQKGADKEELRKADDKGRAQDERWHVRKDGSRFWSSGFVRPVRDEKGNLRGFAKVARDITERKKAEEERERLLQESERRATELRAVIENIPDAVYIGDENGITMCNGAAREMLGFGSVEELNQQIHLLAERLKTRYADTEERIPREDEVFNWALRGETRVREVIARHLKSGQDVILRSAAAPIRHKGRVVGAVAVNTDITERKRAEEELQRSSERIMNILESITDAFFALDKQWRFTYLNRQAEVVLQRRRGELLGKNIWEEYPEAVGSTFYKKYHEALASGESVQFEEFYPPRGVWFEVKAYPSEEGLSVYFRDVTERKRTEEELRARTLQQAAVAELGRIAIGEGNLQKLMEDAVGLVVRTLGVEYCEVLELLPDGEELLLRAGVGWKEGLVGRATVGAGLDSQAGYTLLSDEPVIVQDLRSESRFSGPPSLHEHGVVSGMSTIIRGRERPFGVLGAHTKERRVFTEDDVYFLRAVANVLAAAIEREQAEKAMQTVREAERSRIARDMHDVMLQDLVQGLYALQIARMMPPDEGSAPILEGIIEALQRSVRGLREAIYDLHPPDARGRRFAEAVGETLHAARRIDPDIEMELVVGEGFPEKLPDTVGRELLRILQEALTNARRHSGSHHVRVVLEADTTEIRAEVSDDGKGFEPGASRGGLGRTSMRERAAALGGTLQLESKPGEGTTVRLRMPRDLSRL